MIREDEHILSVIVKLHGKWHGIKKYSDVSLKEFYLDMFHGEKFLNNLKSKFVVFLDVQLFFSLPIALTVEQSSTAQVGIYFSPY